jgi:hypothetical protein
MLTVKKLPNNTNPEKVEEVEKLILEIKKVFDTVFSIILGLCFGIFVF